MTRSGFDAQASKLDVENEEFVSAEIFLVTFCMADKKLLVPQGERNENRPFGLAKPVQEIKDRMNRKTKPGTGNLHTFKSEAWTSTETFSIKEGRTSVKVGALLDVIVFQ
jgi:hypothetical protein